MAVQINKGRALTGLSITPLIDVVFLLLIFFLVATKFDDEERLLDIHLPEASEAVPMLAMPQELIINVTRGGEYFLAGKQYNLSELESILRQAWGVNPTNASVIIRGDRTCPFGVIVAVANICQKIGIQYSTITRDESE